MSSGVWLLFLLVTCFNLAYNASLPLHPDEAYYWVWSRNLEWSYYDHPPMVAYMIRFISMLGESEAVIRLSAVLAMSATAWLIFRTGCLLFSREAGETALLVYLLVPMTHVGYLAVTPDPFLSFFWALTLYLTCIGLFTQRRYCLLLAGTSIGCALLSKYTGVLLPIALLLFLAFSPRFHPQLLGRRMLAAAGLAALVFSPVLIWNWSHDWISFRYQFEHGVAEEKIINLATFMEFFFGQAAVSNPFLFCTILFFLLKSPLRTLKTPKLAVLAWPFAFTVLFLGYNALYKKSELNWAMPAMISGSVLLGYWLQDTARRRVLIGAGAFLLLALLLFKGPELVPGLPGELVMKNKFSGNDKLFAHISKSDTEFVLSDNYENASIIAYYLPGRPEVHILERMPVSQYSFWRSRLTAYAGRDALWIGEDEPSADVRTAFAAIEPVETLLYADRFVTKRYRVYRCRNYNGLLP